MDENKTIYEPQSKFDIRPLLLVVGLIVAEYIVLIALYAAFGINLKEDREMSIYDSAFFLVSKIIPLLIALIFTRKRFKECGKKVFSNIGKSLLMIVICFAVFYMFNLAASYYQTYMDKLFNIGEATNQEGIYAYFNASKTSANYILLFFTIVIAAPLLEELTYRELIFSAFKKINWLVPVFVSALIFGLIHMAGFTLEELVYFPIYFLPGLCLGLIYHYSGNNFLITFSIHMLNNLIAFVSILYSIS